MTNWMYQPLLMRNPRESRLTSSPSLFPLGSGLRMTKSQTRRTRMTIMWFPLGNYSNLILWMSWTSKKMSLMKIGMTKCPVVCTILIGVTAGHIGILMRTIAHGPINARIILRPNRINLMRRRAIVMFQNLGVRVGFWNRLESLPLELDGALWTASVFRVANVDSVPLPSPLPLFHYLEFFHAHLF